MTIEERTEIELRRVQLLAGGAAYFLGLAVDEARKAAAAGGLDEALSLVRGAVCSLAAAGLDVARLV